MNQKTVIELPQEEFHRLSSTLEKILQIAENIGKVTPPETLTRKEFMAEAKIGHNKMNNLLRTGKLKYTRLGPRTISIEFKELARYKRGEIK